MAPGLRDYLILCKPRVVLLMLLTTWAGMYLGASQSIPWWLWINATLGIALMSGSAATLNHIIDHRIDALMDRTKNRPLATGKLSLRACLDLRHACKLDWILPFFILVLTHSLPFLTLLAAIGYSAVYSLYLKRATSQNIVIGGLIGCHAAFTRLDSSDRTIDPQGLATSVHHFHLDTRAFLGTLFASLSRIQKSRRAYAPITHGISFTKLNIVLYSLLTIACSLFPML